MSLMNNIVLESNFKDHLQSLMTSLMASFQNDIGVITLLWDSGDVAS